MSKSTGIVGSFFSVLISIFLLSCSDNSTSGSNKNSTKQITHESTVLPGQIVTIPSTGVTFTEDTMDVLFDSTKSSKLIANGDTITFVVPLDMSSGKHKLTSNKLTVNLTVGETPVIENSTAYFDSVSTVAKDIITTFDPTNSDSLSAFFAQMQSDFNALSGQEQRDVAAIISANASLFNRLDSLNSEYKSEIANIRATSRSAEDIERRTSELFLLTRKQMVNLISEVAIAVPATLAAAALTTPAGGLIVGAFFAVRIGSILSDMNTTNMELNALRAFADESSRGATRSTMTFTNKIGTDFPVTLSFHALSAKEGASKESLVAPVVTAINTLDSLWDKLTAKAPVLKKLSNQPKSISEYQGESGSREVLAKYLKLANISNPKVTGTLTASADGSPVLTFTSKDTTEDQTFTFDIVYTNEGVSKSVKQFSGVVGKLQPIEGWYAGTYTVGRWEEPGDSTIYDQSPVGTKKKACFYFKYVNNKLYIVSYVESFNSSIPSFYHCQYFFMSDGFFDSAVPHYLYRIFGVGNNWFEYKSGNGISLGIELDYLKVEDGVKIASFYPYSERLDVPNNGLGNKGGYNGWIYKGRYSPNYLAPDHGFAYQYRTVDINAVYVGTSAPAGVNADIVNKLIDSTITSPYTVP